LIKRAHLEVDGVYFKLYRELLIRQCGLFRDMLSLPRDKSSTEGTCIEDPIHLPDVTASDFRQIIRQIFGL